jgi:hypothetical protein
MTNTLLLQKAIDDAGIKKSTLMKTLNIKSYSTLRRKINNEIGFKVEEIVILCELLHLNFEQRERIFFAKKTELNSVSA